MEMFSSSKKTLNDKELKEQIRKYINAELIKFLKTNPKDLLLEYQNIVEEEEDKIFTKIYKQE